MIGSLHLARLPWGLTGKNVPANAGGLGLIPGLGVNLEKERAAHPSIPPWEISWTVEPGGLQSIGSRKNWRRLATE